MRKLNGKRINVNYEEPAEWMKYSDKNGKVPKWFKGENPTEKYIKSMNIKKQKFIENNRTLIETKQAEFQEKNFLNILEERFLKALKDKYQKERYELNHLSYNELVNSTWDSAKFVKRIPMNISNFIRIAKTYRFYPKDVIKRLENKKWSPKQIAFAQIANIIYDT